MTNLILIYVTCVSKKEAKQIARNLIEHKLIACANIIGNIESIYSYNGEICNDNETLLLLKTKYNLFCHFNNTYPCFIHNKFQIVSLRNSDKICRALDGTSYYQGIQGLNNIKVSILTFDFT